MKYHYQQVDPPLSTYVRSVLVVEGAPGPDSGELPLFTNGMPVLICRTERQPDGSHTLVRLALFGKSASGYWEIDPQTTIVAYFFKPFVLAALFDLSAAELAGERSVDLLENTLPGTDTYIAALKAADVPGTIATLNRLLAAQLEKHRTGCDRIVYATDHILSRPETDILPQIAAELQISARTLQRLFRKYVGISPVHYRRICQFQQSFAQVKSERFGAMADVAFDNGFADQSHFIRAFREFTRTTPQTYLKAGLKPDKK